MCVCVYVFVCMCVCMCQICVCVLNPCIHVKKVVGDGEVRLEENKGTLSSLKASPGATTTGKQELLRHFTSWWLQTPTLNASVPTSQIVRTAEGTFFSRHKGLSLRDENGCVLPHITAMT